MINREIEQEMSAYYNERATEYDELYLGKGPAIPLHVREYKRDVTEIGQMASEYGRGHLIDIACGTGFWVPYYAANCSQITFLDQSDSMLAECRGRIAKLGLTPVAHFVRGDFFDVKLESAAYDCALVGFLLSHLPQEQEAAFFQKLEQLLKPSGQLMVIDGFWSEIRKKHRKKEGLQERVLNNGRTFKVYKRYFDSTDIEEIFMRYRYRLKCVYTGDVFFAAIATCAN